MTRNFIKFTSFVLVCLALSASMALFSQLIGGPILVSAFPGLSLEAAKTVLWATSVLVTYGAMMGVLKWQKLI